MELDYCAGCDFPTFNHEQVVLVQGEFFHRHCFDGTMWTVRQTDLSTRYDDEAN
jgi:hypothetical protein